MKRSSIVISMVVLVFVGSGCAYLTRASVSSGGQQANGHSTGEALSADGRYVVFSSEASNLVPGDTNAQNDVFVRDLRAKTTERVSVASNGAQSNAGGGSPAISGDGRYVAFTSTATNLVSGDTNATSDVFVRNRTAGTTRRVSVATAGTQGNDESASNNLALSGDGRYVAFASNASNLVPGDTNATSDVFVRDRRAGTTGRMSVASDGTQGNNFSGAGVGGDLRVHPSGAAISANGRHVAFSSLANNLATGASQSFGNVYLRDRQASTTALVNVAPSGTTNNITVEAAVSADGRYVAFISYASNIVPNDTNLRPDGFVRDMQGAATDRVTVGSDGNQGDDASAEISISGDGRWVVFASDATNLVPNDTNASIDVFVRDRLAGTTRRVSTTAQGTQIGFGLGAAVSADGRYAAFSTDRADVIGGDTNAAYDVFVRANPTPTVESVVPNAALRGTTASLAVTGSGFLPDDVVSVGDGVTIDQVTFVDPSRLSVHITIASDATAGARNVVVVGVGSGPGPATGAFGLCASCLSIT